jgi:hypothetical protein
VRIADVAPAGAPLLPRPQHIRLLPGHRCGRGYLAPVAQQPALSFWQAAGTPPAIVAWDRIVGVVGTLGTTRYLRYVLSTSTERRERI